MDLFVHDLGSGIIDCCNLDGFLVQAEADTDHAILSARGNDFVWTLSGVSTLRPDRAAAGICRSASLSVPARRVCRNRPRQASGDQIRILCRGKDLLIKHC